jgi:hypothetical protein
MPATRKKKQLPEQFIYFMLETARNITWIEKSSKSHINAKPI